MKVLSIQSDVAVGMVGNRVACFALQRSGIECWQVNTVRYSNHPGHGAFSGMIADPMEISALLHGIETHAGFQDCAAILSGYLGHEAIGELILETVTNLKKVNPQALYACDPVIGDNGKLYVRPAIEDFFRDHAIRHADILTPNHFEFSRLIGHQAATYDAITSAAQILRAKMPAVGPQIVLISGVVADETPDDAIDIVVAAKDGCALCRTPRLNRHFSGAGDLLACVFLARILAGQRPADAMAHAASAVYAILVHTQSSDSAELDLIAAQEFLHAPPRRFVAMRI